MFGMYTKKDVEKLVERLREEYDGALAAQQRAAEELKAENRALSARLSQLEAERSAVSDALIGAVKAGERIKQERADTAENENKELSLLIGKCRLLLADLTAKYPDEEDVRSFAAFVDALQEEAGEEDSLDMEEVLAPKQPLDLAKLCKDLGLMEEEAETKDA